MRRADAKRLLDSRHPLCCVADAAPSIRLATGDRARASVRGQPTMSLDRGTGHDPDVVRYCECVDAINTFGVSAGRFALFWRRFASSIPLLSQLKSIFEPGSIPGSSTENMLVRGLKVPNTVATSRPPSRSREYAPVSRLRFAPVSGETGRSTPVFCTPARANRRRRLSTTTARRFGSRIYATGWGLPKR